MKSLGSLIVFIAVGAFYYWAFSSMGESDVAYMMGNKYFYGLGVPQDYAEAAKWFRKSEEIFFGGNRSEAQAKLGFMYENGYGVPKDYTEAVKWYREAAEQGNAEAQNNLGAMYENGRGVLQDRIIALALYTLAAKNENAHKDAPGNRDRLAQKMSQADIEAAQALAERLRNNFYLGAE